MSKRLISVLISIFALSNFTFGIDAWIRINQLGYLPFSQKKAVFISESVQSITQFSIHDALTNEKLIDLQTLKSFGDFQTFKSSYILDFSSFKSQGAFYIKAGLVYSPTIYINKNIYLGTADFVLNFLRGSRCDTNFILNDNCQNGYDIEAQEDIVKEEPAKTNKQALNKPTLKKTKRQYVNKLDVVGGWHNAGSFSQSGAIAANTVFQMLFAYQLYPKAFSDIYDAGGNANSNGIPDVLDEAKWGLDWLLKMYPSKDKLYHQVVNDNNKSEESSVSSINENRNEFGFQKSESTVYLATGKPQGSKNEKNKSNGIASIAGKYASAFALGANLYSTYLPTYADRLSAKALDAYELGKNNPGVCQSLRLKPPYNFEESNWTDDMELAASQIYLLTYHGGYMHDAAKYGRMEPITPWMFSDTTNHYQWFPFLNLGHYMLANVENPRFQKEFLLNILNGIQRVKVQAVQNPFNIGVPMILGSNNLVTAMATQCSLYRNLTKDSTYIDMETALIDWMMGCNPWGTSMVVGMPKNGISPLNPHVELIKNPKLQNNGGLVNGPVAEKVFQQLISNEMASNDRYIRFQTPFAVYHDNKNDFATNEPSLDGTAALAYLLANKQLEGVPNKTADKNDFTKGTITRTDSSKKHISIVFSGQEYDDGAITIQKVLKKTNVKASFFFSSSFYRNNKFKKVIKKLQEEKHYLGAGSDKNLFLCSLLNSDSLLVNKTTFLNDIKANYAAMEEVGVKKNQAPFFMPAYACNNDSISLWCNELGLVAINGTSDALSNTDASIPEMREKYFSSLEIFNRIIQIDKSHGLNGYILHFNIGTDKRRQDKFYNKLLYLIIELKGSGYEFVDLYNATDMVDRELEVPITKKGRTN